MNNFSFNLQGNGLAFLTLNRQPVNALSTQFIASLSELFDEIGNFDESLPACEDYDLWLRIAVKYAFHFIEEPLIVKQGGHADQLSRKYWGMDRFRVAALKKLLDQNSLDQERLQLTRSALVEKCSVLIQGFEKRGKKEEEFFYRAIANKYS